MTFAGVSTHAEGELLACWRANQTSIASMHLDVPMTTYIICKSKVLTLNKRNALEHQCKHAKSRLPALPVPEANQQKTVHECYRTSPITYIVYIPYLDKVLDAGSKCMLAATPAIAELWP